MTSLFVVFPWYDIICFQALEATTTTTNHRQPMRYSQTCIRALEDQWCCLSADWEDMIGTASPCLCVTNGPAEHHWFGGPAVPSDCQSRPCQSIMIGGPCVRLEDQASSARNSHAATRGALALVFVMEEDRFLDSGKVHFANARGWSPI